MFKMVEFRGHPTGAFAAEGALHCQRCIALVSLYLHHACGWFQASFRKNKIYFHNSISRLLICISFFCRVPVSWSIMAVWTTINSNKLACAMMDQNEVDHTKLDCA